MATAKNLCLVHEHACPQCGLDYFCGETCCAPSKPGRTPRFCEPCASNPPAEPKRFTVQDQISALKAALRS